MIQIRDDIATPVLLPLNGYPLAYLNGSADPDGQIGHLYLRSTGGNENYTLFYNESDLTQKGGFVEIPLSLVVEEGEELLIPAGEYEYSLYGYNEAGQSVVVSFGLATVTGDGLSKTRFNENITYKSYGDTE